uniref:ZP domain-containing protein n=1 Tax=Ciona savignyi TaxID=51511 RepID=H2Y6M5_CIOSA
MVTNGCPVDPTLSVLPSASSAVRFKYNVFEFVTTRTLANSNKLPVYFHMIFAACTSSDTSAPCTATCTPSGRRRRSLEEPKIPHTSTIGPFRVGSPVERPSNQQPLQVLIRRGKHVNYFSNFNLLLVAIGVVVMIELLLARRSKVATKDTKAVDFQCTEIAQPLEKKVEISDE